MNGNTHWAARLLPKSLVGRVFALYTVVLVAFVVSGLAAFYRWQFTVELENAQDRAAALASVLHPTISDSAVIGDYDTIRRTLERAVHQSAFASAAFIDLRGGRVVASSKAGPEVLPPGWLRRAVEDRLLDTNQPISVGGKDYGVLRLQFAHAQIAGSLWSQTRAALGLGLLAIVTGLLLIRFPLVHWLGNLSRIKSFEAAMADGAVDPTLLSAQTAPSEFRATFAVLGRAAATLQAQREQAAVTLAAIADGVITLDAGGRVLLANPAACAMAARPAAALQGRTLRELFPQLLQGQEGATLQPWSGRRVTLADGPEPLILDTTLSAIKGADGQVAGFVLACRDVSEQHQLDQRLRAELTARQSALVALRQVLENLPHDRDEGLEGPQAAAGGDSGDLAAISAMISGLVARLQARGAQLDAIFALSADGFVSFDGARRANYVSPAFSILTGLPAEQVLGQTETAIEALLRAQCADPRAWGGLAALHLTAAASQGSGAGTESKPGRRERFELLRPTRRVLEIGLRGGDSAAVSQVLSLRDVTHESEVDQMKSEFLSTAAHEMRTPMASIYGFVELMLYRDLKPERQREVLDTIHRQSQLMINIVNELLDLARIEARRGSDFQLQRFDLASLVHEVVHDFNPPLQRALPEVQVDLAPTAVRVDRDKLQQALGNVLSNAYKYSPAGGAVSVRLLAGVADSGQRLVGIEVRDRGIGMTPEQLARVSERFYRADASGNIPGTGLGMSIVKEIIELLGGRLALASEPDNGTTVTLWLPAAAAEEAAPNPALEIA